MHTNAHGDAHDAFDALAHDANGLSGDAHAAQLTAIHLTATHELSENESGNRTKATAEFPVDKLFVVMASTNPGVDTS